MQENGTHRLSFLTTRAGFWPVAIAILALAPRLVFVAISEHPGLWDPTEYYLLAANLHDGRGFTLDHIWSFANDPVAVTHPLDHWLPLPGIVAAGSFALFGVSVPAALLPFALLGAVQSLLVYAFARRIGASHNVQVFAALATAWLPWLFLSSLHTDTTSRRGSWRRAGSSGGAIRARAGSTCSARGSRSGWCCCRGSRATSPSWAHIGRAARSARCL